MRHDYKKFCAISLVLISSFACRPRTGSDLADGAGAGSTEACKLTAREAMEKGRERDRLSLEFLARKFGAGVELVGAGERGVAGALRGTSCAVAGCFGSQDVDRQFEVLGGIENAAASAQKPENATEIASKSQAMLVDAMNTLAAREGSGAVIDAMASFGQQVEMVAQEVRGKKTSEISKEIAAEAAGLIEATKMMDAAQQASTVVDARGVAVEGLVRSIAVGMWANPEAVEKAASGNVAAFISQKATGVSGDPGATDALVEAAIAAEVAPKVNGRQPNEALVSGIMAETVRNVGGQRLPLDLAMGGRLGAIASNVPADRAVLVTRSRFRTELDRSSNGETGRFVDLAVANVSPEAKAKGVYDFHARMEAQLKSAGRAKSTLRVTPENKVEMRMERVSERPRGRG